MIKFIISKKKNIKKQVRTDKNILELARVTLINIKGEKLIDDFVKP